MNMTPVETLNYYNQCSTLILSKLSNAASYSDSIDRISDSERYIISLIINCILCLPLCCLGMMANVINIIVFIKQQSGDSITVSLAGLAVADFASLLFLLWRDVLYIPGIEDSLLPIDPLPFMYMTGGWPHVYFVRVGSWITAFITLERCLCIAMPLKVKSLITPRRIVLIHLIIYIIVLAAIAPMYYTNQFIWRYDFMTNRSRIGLTYSDDKNVIETVVLPINGNAIPMGALVVNIICTAILVVKLKYHRNWRQTKGASGSSRKPGDAISKETKVMRMAVTISMIYIVCFGPVSLVILWMTTDPEFRLDGKLKNSFIVSASFTFILEAFNSSVNIFVYYNMSSNFRSTFLRVFHREPCRVRENASVG